MDILLAMLLRSQLSALNLVHNFIMAEPSFSFFKDRMIGHQRTKENVEKVKAKVDRLDWTEMESNQEKYQENVPEGFQEEKVRKRQKERAGCEKCKSRPLESI